MTALQRVTPPTTRSRRVSLTTSTGGARVGHTSDGPTPRAGGADAPESGTRTILRRPRDRAPRPARDFTPDFGSVGGQVMRTRARSVVCSVGSLLILITA